MKESLVSVIIPYYNGADFIENTLSSILGQDYESIEIIIVNDGSTDDSHEFLNKLIKIDYRIKLYHTSNQGIASARNFGINKATGEFISFCDQDDLWECNKISKQLPLFNDHAVQLVYCGSLIVSLSSKVISENVSNMFRGYVFDKLIENNFIRSCSVIVRTSILETIGGFNTNKALMGSDDWNLWLKISLENKIDFVDESLCSHIIHDRNYSLFNEKMNIAQLECVSDIEKLTCKLNIKKNWDKIRYKLYLNQAIVCVFNSQFKRAYSLYKLAYNIFPTYKIFFSMNFYRLTPDIILLFLQKIKRKFSL